MTVYAPEKPVLKAVPADNPANPENSGDVVDSEFASNRDDPEDAGDLEDPEILDNVESSDNAGNTAESETTEKSEDLDEEEALQPDYDNSYSHGDSNFAQYEEGPAPAAPGAGRQSAQRPTVTVTEDVYVTFTVEPPREVIQQAPMHDAATDDMAITGQDDVPAASAAFPTVPDDAGLPEAEEEAPSIPSPAEEAPLPAPGGSALPSDPNAPVPEVPSGPDPTDITEAPIGECNTSDCSTALVDLRADKVPDCRN